LIHEEIRPSLPLVEKMAQIATGIALEAPVTLAVHVRGDISGHDSTILATSALKGAVTALGAESVTYVNTPALAAEKGMTATVSAEADSPFYRSMISLHAAFADGRSIVVDGTLMGIRKVEKIIAVDGFDLDLPPTDNLLFLRYADKPGVVGIVGSHLSKVGINIAGMQVARSEQGGDTLMAITVDQLVSADVANQIGSEVGATLARSVSLVN
jgi:D-3-phosphoglycerate dehydrogenase